MNWKTIIIILLIFFISLIVISLLIRSLISLYKLKIKRNPIQLPEIIDDKYFTNSSNNQFKLISNNLNNFNEIILAVHDLYTNPATLSNVFAKNKLILSFSQREHKVIKYSVGNTINNINDFLLAIENKYPGKQITILLEGFSCGLLNYLKTDEKVRKVIMLNPISNFKRFRFSFFTKIRSFFGIILGFNKLINTAVDWPGLIKDKNVLNQITNIEDQKSLQEIIQINRANKKIFSKKYISKNLQNKTLEIHIAKNNPLHFQNLFNKYFVLVDGIKIKQSDLSTQWGCKIEL